ncbi:MAG TPA: aldose epimerase family protein [bacterium]|nr:aldose epimerase family protein [bacterium]
MGCTYAPFGRSASGEEVMLYTLANTRGTLVKITPFGGIITSIIVPDRDGRMGDIVLGFDDLSGYTDKVPYFGAIIGRYGNRIAGGRFSLDGRTFSLACNNGPNHLHGGIRGFDKVLWRAEAVQEEMPGITLTYLSRDMEEGYPGNLAVEVIYTLTDDDRLVIDYSAVTDKKSVINLTNHTYFNLGGMGEILDHELFIDADRYTPTDAGLIPTGELTPVQDTPFDFRTTQVIGARIGARDEQLVRAGGYDHNYVLNGKMGELKRAGAAFEPRSGRVVEVWTTEPGMQFYTGNFLDGTLTGKGGMVYRRRTGFCLETQHFPDSPNQPEFPTTVISPGENWHSQTVFRFMTR